MPATCAGREVTPPSALIEIDDVLEQRMAPGWV